MRFSPQRLARAALLGLALLTAPHAAHAAPARQIVIEGALSGGDNETYRRIPFDAPKGVVALTVELSYTGRDQRTTIDLGLADPQRFRGWSGGNKARVTIEETNATPSYLPGPLPPGRWRILLGVPNIRPAAHAAYKAIITFRFAGDPLPPLAFADAPLKGAPGWYRGDLHAHSAHSDGTCKSMSGRIIPCPVFKIVEDAQARGLDFMALTDHNTASQMNALRELQPYFDTLLLLPGEELTTFKGHANLIGATQAADFGATKPAATINESLRQARARGELTIINHPALPSGEICMGCGWTAGDADLALIDAVEVVNGGALAAAGQADGPLSGVTFWEGLLNKGRRVTATGGSDTHVAGAKAANEAQIGRPTTVVFARDLSQSALFEGIRAGRVFIDVDAGRDRLLDLQARAGSATAVMGGALRAPAGADVVFTASAAGVPGGALEVIEDGAPGPKIEGALSGGQEQRTFHLKSDGARHWLRLNVRGADGRLLLIGNPIYLNAETAR